MIRYLRGRVLTKIRSQLILDVNGVGYDIFVTPPVLTGAVVGDEAAFHVSEAIREDAHDLFGFATEGERDAFDLLRRVSGVGPKVAMAIIGFYPPENLLAVIGSGDEGKLSLVPGIGKKLAGKIIVELRDKVAIPAALEASVSDPDLIDGLRSLGYSAAEITKVLPKVPPTLTNTSERLTWVLRHLAE